MTTPETLTEEERGIIPTRGDTPLGLAIAKLLRIHDALQARVKELELLRSRIERLRDGLSFDSGWEEGERVVLTRILNGKDPE